MEAIDKIGIKHIRYFLAVADHGSFRQAAFKLNTTQPSLSNLITGLEETLGVKLFERNRRGTHITPAGRELLANARRVLEETQGMMDRADTISGGGFGTHRLGVTPTLGPYLLPHILPSIHRHYNRLQLYVREEPPSDLEMGLVNGQYDLILSTLPIVSKELVVAPLCREPLRLITSRDHKLAEKVRINRMDLLGEPILTISEHHLFHRQITELCERVGAQVRRDYEGSSLDTLRQMVVMGMGSAFLPALYVRSEIRDEEELRIAVVEGVDVMRNHALAWRHSSPNKAFYRQLAGEIRDIIGSSLSDVVIPIHGSR
jgi:LysR family hydrogen peroxide-inducible transcriptional activator